MNMQMQDINLNCRICRGPRCFFARPHAFHTFGERPETNPTAVDGNTRPSGNPWSVGRCHLRLESRYIFLGDISTFGFSIKKKETTE